jgi:hypothetical protein
MHQTEQLLEQAKLVIYRLERISADSVWAHRSSGQRGALLKWVESFEKGEQSQATGEDVADLITLENLIRAGYEILEKAALERFR